MPAPAPIGFPRRAPNVSGFKPAGAAPILKVASHARIEHEREFRAAIALLKREARIRAAFRIGAGLEIRLPVRAPVIAGMPSLAGAVVAVPRILPPAALGGRPRQDPTLVPAPVSLVPPRQGDRAVTRMLLAAAAILQSGEGHLRTIHIARPGPLGGPAAPRMAELKAVTGVRPAPRGNAARPPIAARAPETVVLPARRTGPPQPECSAAGFAIFEFVEHGEIRNTMTRASEAPLPQLVLPPCPGPDPVLVRALHVPDFLNGDPRSHAGMCSPAEVGFVIRTEIAPAITSFEAAPDLDDGREALAPAVPDHFEPRRARRIGSRLFR